MNVLVSTEFFHSRVGGAERVLESVVQGLMRRNHKVTVCSFEQEYDCASCNGRELVHLNFPTFGPLDLSFRAITAVPHLEGYDVIFTHHFYHFSSFFAALISRYHHVPLVVKPIGIYSSRFDLTTLLYDGLAATQGRFCLRSASLVVPTTVFEAKMLEAKGVPPGRIKIIPSGVNIGEEPTDSEMERFVVSYGISHDPLVLFVGRLEHLKGVETLLDALLIVSSQMPTIQCILAGNQDQKFVSRLLSSGTYDSLRLIRTGHLPPAELNAAYRLSTVFVLPSLSELSSLTLKEAQLARLPVIATRVGGNPEYVLDGVNGILVNPGRPDELARAIITLVQNQSMRARMGQEAFKTASKYSLDWYVEATTNAISEVAKK